MYSFPFLFHPLLLGRKSRCTAHMRERGGMLYPHFLEAAYKESSKFFGILLHRRFVFSPPFIYSIIFLKYQCGFMNIYTFGYSVKYVFGFFFFSSCSNFGLWEFSQSACSHNCGVLCFVSRSLLSGSTR